MKASFKSAGGDLPFHVCSAGSRRRGGYGASFWTITHSLKTG